MMDPDEEWINNIWLTDKAHFHLDGSINRQNLRVWGGGNHAPEEVVERTLHSLRLTTWCSISPKGIIVGPLWFEDENSQALTVNKERYQDVLRQFCSILRQQ
jgi:hypothetical protein